MLFSPLKCCHVSKENALAAVTTMENLPNLLYQ